MNDNIGSGMTFQQIDEPRIVGDDYVFDAIDVGGQRWSRVVPIRGEDTSEWRPISSAGAPW